MARFPVSPSSRGYVALTSRKLEAGPLDAGSARDLTSALEQLRNALNGGLSLGDGTDGSKAGNLDAQIRVIYTPSHDADFAVAHGLGRRAVGYLVLRKSAACDVWSGSAHGDTEDVIWLQAALAGVTLTLLVF